jgi:hypothetical protein
MPVKKRSRDKDRKAPQANKGAKLALPVSRDEKSDSRTIQVKRPPVAQRLAKAKPKSGAAGAETSETPGASADTKPITTGGPATPRCGDPGAEESQESRDEEFLSEDDEGPYYNLGRSKDMYRLWEIAQRIVQIEEVRAVYFVDPSPPSIEDAIKIEATRSEQATRYAEPSLMRDIAIQISEGNFEALAKIVTALKAAKEGVESLSLEKAACVWTIVACDRIWGTGRIRSGVTWHEVQMEAVRLCALDKARRKKGLTPEQLGKMSVGLRPGEKEGAVRSINWQRVKKRLSIELKTAPAGRPTDVDVEARERKNREAQITVRYTK